MKLTLLLTLLTALLITASGVNAQVPKLSSYPAAQATLFIDFDGHTVTGTSWNWGGPIYAQSIGYTNEVINEIYDRVAEDYRPFNLNVTTDSAVYLAAPFRKRMRIIVTPTSQWYGSAGGVAFVGSFIWGNETPGWVFAALLNNNTKAVAEAISHEAGHTLGLQHQSDYNASCQKTAEYGVGSGTGEIGWAPIMGVGYYKNLTTWHNGPNTVGCSNLQNDMEIIAGNPNGFGFRTDDHSNTSTLATPISLAGQQFLVDGIVNRTADIDAFKMVISNNANFKLNAIPENVGSGNSGANMDIRVSILNENNDTIGIYNPSTLLDAGIDTTLNAGTYYVLVDGVGNINKSNYGSLGYYSMQGDLNIVLPVHQFRLRGIASGADHALTWSFRADEELKNIVVETSDNGTDFRPLVDLHADARSFSYKAMQPVTWYRLKAVTAKAERPFLSNVLTLKNSNTAGKQVQIFSNIIAGTVDIKSNGNHPYHLFDAAGKLLSSGTLISGINNIAVPQQVKGLLFLRLKDGLTEWTEKLIKP